VITADWTVDQPLPKIGATVARIGDGGAWQLPDDDLAVMATTERLSGCRWQYGVVVLVIEEHSRLGIDRTDGPEPLPE
jgi:hypothetical protein